MAPPDVAPDAVLAMPLLVEARTSRPVLEVGLARAATERAPRPGTLPGGVESLLLDSPDGAPNDLAAQRWGVVAVQGPEGDAQLEAIRPLLQYRSEQQQAPVKVYRVSPGLGAEAAASWQESVHQASDVSERERPRYLLLLGDLPQVSLSFQQVMAHGAYVGRLHVSQPDGGSDLRGYTDYANKVVACEQRSDQPPTPRALLYTAHDGTGATRQGHAALMRPCLQRLQERWPRERPGATVTEVPYDGTATGLLRHVGEARSGLLLSVSHGLGRPPEGWSSVEEQRRLQGAMSLGPGEVLSGEWLRDVPFLPGGMWLNVSCFGAATPSESAFHAWLTLLAREGAYQASANEVLQHLPGAGEQPFLAALPQALLANPRGPLAVVGHADLTWTLGLLDATDPQRARPDRLLSALETLANGSRAGVALDALLRFYRGINERVLQQYQARENARVGGTKDPTQPAKLGLLWMLRNDLRGYLLLGDPAARLTAD
ncbi:hypothetical protein LZ198_00695 [Myxococcus sp. K15C18031901]|uniref:hypothetical protein n=1 Tax=Myxococcus dinghuensis TaxID=2906761 RepID=UPI0020A7C346|nr:hypothetical protein [Myxococcus dinghuensis]MCP3097383.1 hypothetical protein [Myxococcus dinghuensis]